ncbi:hypothetical protein A3K34_03560 [candidate division WWE3 bacterium RIFOXYC1_FULL_40_10]|nr:MAG: hypothetical protein A3K58_03560 [candidate division WWE3 bacterium RIFOXYB1_FULL_40_22]OGC61923.1 MAG: hypothetical protein A3K37_03560 [candidate division WWE3 bacterium RIFOXYA1_FULL_40_11]OGC66306.1 MAG: hypothetical protein A3K34_03560 [candidate division WWE3 bacterium RIFOXYC1_FULL_40_10]OGC67909.1 MAG: hypothetical protein A2450_01750 [candidate division WWE3 bacterium RIFOXYC2_FULL_40_11]OGC70572.1 MAG: hypothetical protein A2602_02745 [candidate division WWE3 bacterium RIFOXYD
MQRVAVFRMRGPFYTLGKPSIRDTPVVYKCRGRAPLAGTFAGFGYVAAHCDVVPPAAWQLAGV